MVNVIGNSSGRINRFELAWHKAYCPALHLQSTTKEPSASIGKCASVKHLVKYCIHSLIDRVQQESEAMVEQAQQFALTEKDIQAGINEINSAKSDLALREQLAIQKIEEASHMLEMESQVRESNINEQASKQLEAIAKAESAALQRISGKHFQRLPSVAIIYLPLRPSL